MAEPIKGIFGLAPGVDFPAALLNGLEDRLAQATPRDWAQVEIYVNTRRMQRRLAELFLQGPARLMPKIRLVSDLGHVTLGAGLPAPIPPLRRRLELSQLIAGLLDRQPDLAPRSALLDLSDSLAALMDEMHSEGVSPAVLREMDVSHLSEHWARSLQFLDIVEQFFGEQARERPDREAHTRMAIEYLAERWQDTPPEHPVIIAGSTGSRGATAMLMRAVATLPQGAVVLPGFDFDMPKQVWDGLDDALTAEDHPQFRFAQLLQSLDLSRDDVQAWHAQPAPDPGRNQLISLALRPAPITDQWLVHGPDLGALEPRCAGISLIEAPSPRAEANAIALCLRDAAERGETAALITPDRMLTRQVTAVLDRWGIEPDDSAGMPLQLSVPGRFLRQVAALFGQVLTAVALLALLKHPLTATGGARGDHLRLTRELELHLRRHGLAFPSARDLTEWAKAQTDPIADSWAAWLGGLLEPLALVSGRSLHNHITAHLKLAEALAAGPEGTAAGDLWDKPAGKAAQSACASLLEEAAFGGDLTPSEYADLFRTILANAEVHDPLSPHPGVMIWGTLEARVQGADLVILAGLNEGSWPQAPAPDPWLNRDMRRRAGLLLPERRIGLAAHDFQQAAAAKRVVISRAIRDTESETVPSRWLSRLTNLLSGLPEQGGETALEGMRARGQYWLNVAAQMERPPAIVPTTLRPAPSPPVSARPKQLSVTRIQTLIRNPYAIYAERVLGLRALDPIRAKPDPALRGTVLHKVMEEFLSAGVAPDPVQAKTDLMRIGETCLKQRLPWPSAQRLWLARISRIADWFISGEIDRQVQGQPIALEKSGSITLQNGFSLTAEADRIDQLTSNELVIFDYKTGSIPTKAQIDNFDQQLLLEAAMLEQGGFAGLRGSVAFVAHIGLGNTPKYASYIIGPGDSDKTLAQLTELISAFEDRDLGYQSRRAVYETHVGTDYDHLSRFGEWDESDEAVTMEVGA